MLNHRLSPGLASSFSLHAPCTALLLAEPPVARQAWRRGRLDHAPVGSGGLGVPCPITPTPHPRPHPVQSALRPYRLASCQSLHQQTLAALSRAWPGGAITRPETKAMLLPAATPRKRAEGSIVCSEACQATGEAEAHVAAPFAWTEAGPTLRAPLATMTVIRYVDRPTVHRRQPVQVPPTADLVRRSRDGRLALQGTALDAESLVGARASASSSDLHAPFTALLTGPPVERPAWCRGRLDHAPVGVRVIGGAAIITHMQ